MENCIEKHVQSIAAKIDVKMYPDNLTEFTVPYLLETLDVPKEELINQINGLRASGNLILKDPYQTMACPSCGSPDPFSRMVCPKCGSVKIEIKGNNVECKECGLRAGILEALNFVCKTCGKNFGVGNAKWITLGSLHALNAPDIGSVATAIKSLGIYPKRCHAVTGASGMIHHFDFVFEHNESASVVDVEVEQDAVNVKYLMEFLSKVYDSGIKEAYFIAVPKLNVPIDPGKKNIKVIEASSIEGASDKLKQILIEHGISSKIVH
ncbi:MAG: hypothetical protein JRN26_07065 [Nitrososphaerota archaeon]|jgi:DNA-directed RNA polymerase subunit RPC12/RpoP|nr:hypothetical protein [Nitrososphaerota archaeon]MDG6927391.1 hypothetical protein [Nitrososphaerota archaeon]MDG6931195.1 hypothetical protein [Nitrososphaerota archaeon]MDG6931858.1 hypothetical protein [Nitrososphaerota archaeon]MDG6936622.1 hypothetical protein [Nitrososphaerota archaeon]